MEFESVKLSKDEIYPEIFQIYDKPRTRNLGFVTISPFSNCQNYTIGAVINILVQDNAEEIFSYIQRYVAQKRVIILDLLKDQKQIDKLISIFGKENIIFEQSYTNTTNSEMVFFMIKTEGLVKKNSR